MKTPASFWTNACTQESFLLISRGVFIPVPALPTPCTLRVFLEQVLGMDRGYVEERILTLLLNGLAADGLEALLPPGARLGLSAAMPGVAGATLRRGGRYAPMRKDITLKDISAAAMSLSPFWVELRCFNSIAREQGPRLVHNGVAVEHSHLGPALRPLARPLPDPLPSPSAVDLVWISSAV